MNDFLLSLAHRGLARFCHSRWRLVDLVGHTSTGFAIVLIWGVAILVSQQVFAGEPLIVGHRGASHAAPENTLAAFRLAFEEKADGIEGDFYLTADKEIVCHHDKDTERTSGVKLMVETTDYTKLRALDVGTWKGSQYAGERIPKLEEVLAMVPAGKLFVIELKSGPEIVPVLASKLSDRKKWSMDLLIISFDEATVQQCKTLMPDVKAHWLTGFKRDGEAGPHRPNATKIAQMVRQCGADGVGFNGNAEHIDLPFMQRMKASGIKEFHVWTIDDSSLARQFEAWGAMGITTNRPAAIRTSLAD